MQNTLLTVKPYQFTTMHVLNLTRWGIKVPVHLRQQVPYFDTVLISPKNWTIDQLKQMLTVAIEQGEALNIQQAILVAISERAQYLIDGRVMFSWPLEGGVEVNTIANEEAGIPPTAITIDSHTFKELDDLLEVASHQKESALIGQFIRRIQARIVDRQVSPNAR